jgi:hypothetical protein
MSDTLKVVTLLGSLRKGSFNALFTIIFPDLQRPDIRGDGD